MSRLMTVMCCCRVERLWLKIFVIGCRYINELIESILIARTEKERQGGEKADDIAHQRIPDPMPKKMPSPPGLEMTAMGPLESRNVDIDIDPLSKSTEKLPKIVDDVVASTKSQLPKESKSSKVVICSLPVHVSEQSPE